MLEPVSNKTSFPQVEEEVLRFWTERDIFRKSIESRRGSTEYVFYDGPPFATGLPHYGHLLAGTLKDIVPRYHTMRGHLVERRFGWDCHGLPVEYEVEQDLKLGGKRDIEKLGVAAFNERCRSIVLRYTNEWRRIVTRMGRWVDFDNDYKTMDPPYMESIWWVFKSLWDRDLIYEGHRVLPYCPRCATPLSNFETNQGYRDVSDPAITLRFAVRGQPNTYILAWTTTPWTLPSNMGLAVGKDIVYAKIRDGKDTYYLGKDRLPVYYKKPEAYERLEEMPGSKLVGMEYEPLFPYYAGLRARGAFRVVPADFVSTEDGTGVVHTAPGFGELDSLLGKAEGLPAVCPIDAECRFTTEIPDYAGREVKETDTDIMARLKQEGKLIHRGTITHSYPHCWRCETPLIYRAISTWFVRVEQIRDRMLELNRTIAWVPDHLRDGRFGKWLEQARDWAISRNRYWGAPLPVWRSEDGKEVLCVGSIEELAQLSGRKVTDLHKHVVDEIEIRSPKTGKPLRRIPEVLDCWFESGSMPYAQAHYPFENKAHFESHFPADFIAEGLDQTRGWFYTLLVLSTALFDRPAFRNVVVNGLVLAENGMKMSKRLKNYPDPTKIIDTYGADALRLYLMRSPVVRAEDLRFSEEGVKGVLRDILIPLWNAYSFFVTYARIDKWRPGRKAPDAGEANLLDRWILSSLASLEDEVTAAMDGYDLQKAVRPFLHFVDNLTNWYVRRSRRRFWKSQDDADKAQAYATLYHVLLEVSKIAAPFVPFMSEAMYRNLRTDDMPESVHLCDFPNSRGLHRDAALERRMDAATTVVELGRLLRSRHNLKVRQPLARIHIVSRDHAQLDSLRAMSDLILEELNVKEADFHERETGFATLKAKPDFSRLGPRLGPLVKKAAGVIARLDSESLEQLAAGGKVTVTVDGQSVELESQDVVVQHLPHEGMVVAAEGALAVALETALTPALEREGLAREFVHHVQNLRKNADLEVTQRIRLDVVADETVRDALREHEDYVKTETLCLDCRFVDSATADATACDLNGHPAHVGMTKG